MSGLPNIEPVSLMVLLFGAVLGWKALYPIAIYVTLEILLYGIHLWNLNYLYLWPLLAAVGVLCRRCRRPLVWAAVSGLFGLAFGLLCSPVYAALGGIDYAIRWWLAGIGFDVTHAVGNFVIGLLLFVPLRRVLEGLYTGCIPRGVDKS